ncbi:MAG: hypothetical protein ACJ8MH_01045 [Povalibacter sp.]
MLSTTQYCLKCLICLTLLEQVTDAFASAEEIPTKGYYAALSTETDDADGRNLLGEFGLPLGQPGWLHLAVGSSTIKMIDEDVDSTLASIAGGFDTERVSVEVSYSYREDSDTFEQQDLHGSVTLNGARGSIGLDLFHRSAEDETVTSIERRRRDPLSIRTTQSVDGTGIGAHMRFDATQALQLFAAGMTYDYDSDVRGPAFLDRFPRLALRISGVSRDQAFLDDTLRGGLTYRFANASITAQYIRDRELNTEEVTGSTEISANIALGNAWAIAPWIGQSSNDTDGDVLYGGLTVSVIW